MRRAAVGLALIALAVLAAWLLWPDDEPALRDARPDVPPSPADETTPAAKRTPRVRETATPPAPETPQEPSTPAKPGELAESSHPFTVTVLRADGTPAKGATVLVVGPTESVTYPRSASSHATDENGVLRVDDAETRVRIVAWLGAEAAASEGTFAPAECSAVAVRLASAVVVHGRVLLDGEPAAGAEVSLQVASWMNGGLDLGLRVEADESGRFAFPPVAAIGLDANRPPVVQATGDERAAGAVAVDVEKLRRGEEVVVEIASGFTVKGRLVDGQSRPVEAIVQATGVRGANTNAGPDGRFALRLPRGKRWLFANCFKARAHYAVWLGSLDGSSGDVDRGDIVLADGRPLSGVVVDDGGKPVAGASVNLFHDFHVGYAESDADGRFAFQDVSPDAHVVSASARSDAGRAHATLRNVKGGDPELRVVLVGDTIVELRLFTDGDRAPIEDVSVSLRAKPHADGAEWSEPDLVGHSAGSYEFELKGGGSYDFEMIVRGYQPQSFAGVQIAKGRTTPLDLLLRKKHE